MSDRPPFRELNYIALLTSTRPLSEICDILEIEPRMRYDALFLSDRPPIDTVYPDATENVREYEDGVSELITE